MTKPHYEFDHSDTIVHKGIKLTRIIAIGSNGKASGVRGGYIEGESNLVQGSNAWVGVGAKVYESARVSDSARIVGYAEISGDADVRDQVEVGGEAKVCRYATLRGKTRINGCLVITKTPPVIIRSDGHHFTLGQERDGSWRISAGCRYFDFAQAWSHWSDKRQGTPLQLETLAILTYFETIAGIRLSGKQLKKRWRKGMAVAAKREDDPRYGIG